MSWREQWQTGSFRGVEFCWKQSDTTVGRKTARHDYPLRDDAYIEDMGMLPREFTLECYVIGEDYTFARDALTSALEQEGPGILTHPTMGTFLACVADKVRVTESTSEGGMCRFSIPFILAEENKWYPSADVDTGGAVDDKANTAAEASKNEFGDKFTSSGKPQFVKNDAISMTDKICSALDGLRAKFPTNVETPAFIKDLNKIKNSAQSLIGAPYTLAQSIMTQVNQLRDLALTPLNLLNYAKIQTQGLLNVASSIVNLPMSIFNAYASLFDYGTSTSSISQTTPSRIQQAQNLDAFNALVRQAAIIEAARTSSTIDFSSYDEAESVKETLVDAIDTELLEASDTVYAALVDLRAAVVKDISTRGADLSRIVSFTPAQTAPALVIAHRLYGDGGRAEEIIARNKIRHPLFVPGGVALEVLSD
jgi:prophage DNA circulation protein